MNTYFFIGDDAFALRETMMKSYSHRDLDNEERINYRPAQGGWLKMSSESWRTASRSYWLPCSIPPPLSESSRKLALSCKQSDEGRVGIRMKFLKDLWSSFRSSMVVEATLSSSSDPWSPHVFFFSASFFLWSELPNRSDHSGAGEQKPSSSLAGCLRRTEEVLEIGADIYTFSKRR